jgi:hypothetical protein
MIKSITYTDSAYLAPLKNKISLDDGPQRIYGNPDVPNSPISKNPVELVSNKIYILA